jgi:hypothetical protein
MSKLPPTDVERTHGLRFGPQILLAWLEIPSSNNRYRSRGSAGTSASRRVTIRLPRRPAGEAAHGGGEGIEDLLLAPRKNSGKPRSPHGRETSMRSMRLPALVRAPREIAPPTPRLAVGIVTAQPRMTSFRTAHPASSPPCRVDDHVLRRAPGSISSRTPGRLAMVSRSWGTSRNGTLRSVTGVLHSPSQWGTLVCSEQARARLSQGQWLRPSE